MNSDQLVIGSFLERGRSLFPTRSIVSAAADGAWRTTFADYARRVDRLSWALRALGVRRGDRVATLAWNDHRHLELYFGVPRTGAVLHTVNLRLSARQVGEVLAHAGDRVLFVDASMVELALDALEHAPCVEHVVLLGEGPVPAAAWLSYESLLSQQPALEFTGPADMTDDWPAAMCYSSATTGRPKGVVYSHRALYLHSAMLAMADTWGLSHHDTVLPIVPMFHVNAWGIPFTAVWMGAKIVLPGVRPTAQTLLERLISERVTFTAAVPTVWSDVFALIEESGVTLPALRLLISGGGPLPAGLLDQADRLGLPLVHSYGMTEASPLTHVNIQKADADEAPDERRARRLRQGLPVPGLLSRLGAATDGAAGNDGETVGELQLRGPWIAEEYYRDERSADSFAGGWYSTGDIVSVDAGGYIHVVDRVQDLIKSGGEWISTIDLESELSQHKAVARVAVVGVPDARWQERPLAFVELHRGDKVEASELREWLVDRVPRWWIPDVIEVIDKMPLTSVGKLDKGALRALTPC